MSVVSSGFYVCVRVCAHVCVYMCVCAYIILLLIACLVLAFRLILSSGFFGSVLVNVKTICECSCSKTPVSLYMRLFVLQLACACVCMRISACVRIFAYTCGACVYTRIKWKVIVPFGALQTNHSFPQPVQVTGAPECYSFGSLTCGTCECGEGR